ncbi:MAG: TonB family protein [Candidatus Zixiibacteriota bacterium]
MSEHPLSARSSSGNRRAAPAAVLSLLILIVHSYAGPEPARAALIRVPADHPTIQRAIDRSQQGDTILVSPGIYEENLNLYGKSIYLSSTEGFDSTFLRALLPMVPAITITSGEDSTTTIRGFTITSEHTLGSCAILCKGVGPAILYNRIVANSTADNGPAGVSLEGPNCRPLIRGNIFDQNGGPAIGGVKVDAALIDSNAFIRNSCQIGPVMHFRQSANLRINRNLIHGNTTFAQAVLWFEQVQGIAFDHNTVVQNYSGAAGSLTFRDCDEVSITNSILAFDPGRYGIDWQGDGAPVVSGNCLFAHDSASCSGFSADTANNVFEDPLLCAIKDYDFSLASNSPCVRAGADGWDIGSITGVGCDERAPMPIMPRPNDFVAVEEMPEEIEHTYPEYPEKAVVAGASGTVWVQALVDSKGIVVEARILKSSGTNYGFEESALRAAYKNRYRPAMREGRPVAVWVSYKVDFMFRH